MNGVRASMSRGLTRRHIAAAHEKAVARSGEVEGVRMLVRESWQRSLQFQLNPDYQLTNVELDGDELREYRDMHPLSRALPTIQRLLTRHTIDARLIVAIGDEGGRLLWIDGDRTMRRKAEGMLFVEGANWSERAMGTSAPGTALELDRSVQIQGPEHFNRIVHPWSCTAVPIHDPISRAMLGVIDITGGDQAADPATLPLMEAVVAAVEAELHVRRLDERTSQRRVIHHTVARHDINPILSVLGTDRGQLEVDGVVTELSTRHAEILTILAWHPRGLTANKLAHLVYGGDESTATLRSEMVRLRKVLDRVAPSLIATSRPYRLQRTIDIDARRVLDFLERGAHRVALGAYSGELLPTSTSPGIVNIRDEVRQSLREALLTDASADLLLTYARSDDAAYDIDVWRACLALLPQKSPKRAAVVARIERIETELGLSRN